MKQEQNWYYYNKSGEKVGPISVAALKVLVQQGLITRETIIENHTGRTQVAGEVNGLAFPATTAPKTTPKPTGANPFTAPKPEVAPAKPSVTAAAPVSVPVAEEERSSYWILIVGLLLVACVAGIGWKIISDSEAAKIKQKREEVQAKREAVDSLDVATDKQEEEVPAPVEPEMEAPEVSSPDPAPRSGRRPKLSYREWGEPESTVASVAFSPDGKKILTTHKTVREIYLSPNVRSGTVLGADEEKIAKIWDVDRLQSVSLIGHKEAINSAAFSPDGTKVVTASRDAMVRVWDATSGRELLKLVRHTDSVTCAVFSPDGKKIVTGCGDVTTGLRDKTVRIWDADSGKELHVLETSRGVTGIAFPPAGTNFAAFSNSYGKGNIVRMWNVETGKELHGGSSPTIPGNFAAFSPDGKKIITSEGDIWDVGSGRKLQKIEPSNFAVFSPDGRTIYTSYGRIWDADSGEKLHQFEAGSSGAFSPDGTKILTIGNFVRDRKPDWWVLPGIWDVTSGRLLYELKGHKFPDGFVAFSPDGSKVVTTSLKKDDPPRLWDVSALTPQKADVDAPESSIAAPEKTQERQHGGAIAAIAQLVRPASGPQAAPESAQKPVTPNPPSQGTGQEKDILRKKIDFANREKKGVKVELTAAEKEAVVEYLLLAERTLKKKYRENELSSMLTTLDRYKTHGRAIMDYSKYHSGREVGRKKYARIDAFVACLADNARAFGRAGNSSDAREVERRKEILRLLLPECNRLSGNAHNAELNEMKASWGVSDAKKQEREQVEAERKELFGN